MILQATTELKEASKELSIKAEPFIMKVEKWGQEIYDHLPDLIFACIIFFIFIFLARMVKRLMNKYLDRVVDNRAAVNILSNITYFIIILAGLMVALSVMNLSDTVNKFFAAAGIVGVALGFAFQDTAANFISGTFMAFRKNFRVGDLIETNGTTAIVDHIDLRSTKLKTLDGFEVIVPNKEVFQNKLTNYNSYSTRRIDLVCGVGYESDLEKVQRVTLEVIRNIEEIKSTPSPQFFYTEFGDSSINYVCRFWIDFLGMADFLDAKHLAIKAIKKKYDAEGINIPFPIRTLDFGKNNLTINPRKEN